MTTGSNLGTWPVGEVQAPLTASGGNGTFVWNLVNGAPPAGLALRTDVPSFFPAGTAAGLIGVATIPGTYNFTLSVTSAGITVSQPFSIKITTLALKDPFNIPDAFVNAPYSYTMTALNNAGPVAWTATSALPPGMTFVNGILAGTPAAAGFYNINFSMNDGTDTIFKGVGLNVSAVQITSPGMLPNVTRGLAYSFILTASGGTGPYTFASNGLPNGLSLNPSTGVISGTNIDNQGRWDVQVTVTDRNNVSYTKLMALDILVPPVTAGYIQPYGNSTDDFTIGLSASRGFSVWNGGTATFTWTATGLPPGMDTRTGSGITNSGIWPGDLELWGTPTATGVFNIRLTVTDANGLATSQTFPLKVGTLEVNGNDFLPSGARGTAYNKTLRVLGGSSGGYTVSKIGGQFPAGLTQNGMLVSGTPTENGFFNVQFSFTDSAANNLKITNFFNISPTFNVNINNGNDLGQALLNASYLNQLSACCAASTAWSVAAGALPTGITLTTGGLLSGTPTVPGTYTFTVQATDGGNAANFGIRVFTLGVTPLNITNSFTLPFGNTGALYGNTFNVTGASGALAFTLTPGSFLPPGLTLNSTSGTLSGTPAETGQFLFNITVTDAGGQTVTRTFNIFVFAPGVLPPVAIASGTDFGTDSVGILDIGLSATGGNGTYLWTLTGGALPPNTAIRTDLPPGASPVVSAVVTGVVEVPGIYTFTLQVASGPTTASQTFKVKVANLTLLERFNGNAMPDAFVGTPYTYALTPVRNTGTVTFAACGSASMNLPPGMALSPGGVLSGTPTADGLYTLNFNISDSADSICFTPTIRVFAVQITSPGQLPNATQFQVYPTYTLTARGGTGPYIFTFSGNVPSGLTLSAAGVISGTPANGPGRFSFNLTATDANHVSYTKTMNLYVLGAPAAQPSLFTYGTFDDCVLGNFCERPLGVGSGGTAPFTWTVTGLPPGMFARSGSGTTIASVTPSDVELHGTPLQAGLFTIHAVATDANGVSVAQDFKLRISDIGVDGNGLPNATYQQPYSATYRLTGGTAPYSMHTISGSLPAGISATGNGQGIGLSGTPLETGSFSPLVLVTDAGGRTFQVTLFLFVNGANGSTISINQASLLGPFAVGSLSLQFSACCVPSFTWNLAGGSLPPGLTFTNGGLLSGTLTTPGTYFFTIQAADQANPANFAVRAVTMQVTSVSLATGATLPFANVGTPYSQTLAVSGAAGAVTWSLNSAQYLPPGMSLTADGVFTGTPASTGTYFFIVKVQDSLGNFNTRQFNLVVFATGAVPPLGLNLGPNLGTIPIGTITFQLTASGGVPPYHFSYAPGAPVVPGMRVLDGPPLPVSFPSTTTGGFAGVMTPPVGFYATTLRVTDAANTFFDRPINWRLVDGPASLSQSALPKATVGTPYSFTLTGFGGSGPGSASLSWTSPNLPPGLSLSAGGTISGTPATAGAFNFTVTVTDQTSNISVGFTETIAVNPFAIATGGVLPQGQISQAYSQTLTAPNCGSGCTWTVAGGSLPSGIALTTAGVLAGTPANFYNSGFLVQAAGSNGTVQKELSLLIDFNTIQPLFIANGPVFGPNNLNNVVSSALFAQGGTPPYTWSLVSGAPPLGISLTGPGETLGANLLPGFTYLSGRTMQVGVVPFTLRVTDSATPTPASTTKAFTWQVPSIAFGYFALPITGTTLTFNVPYSQALLVLGGTGIYPTWSVVSGSLPAGLTLNPATGVISGTPTNTGSFLAGFQVTDSAGTTVTQNVTLTVAGPSGVVINAGNADSTTAQAGVTSVFGWNPSGGTPPYTYSPVTPYPPGCSIEFGNTILANNGNTYALVCTPLATGDFPFTFKVTDSVGNFGVRTMTLHVAAFNLFSSSALPNGSVGSPYSETILAWDNSSPVTWTVAAGSALPPGLSVAGSTLSGTPAAQGNYSFVLTASDASGLTVNFTFSLFISTIHITNPDIIPAQPIFGVAFTYTFTATGGGATKIWTATGLPLGITMSPDGTLSGTTASTGAFRLIVTVTDGASSYTRPFTLFARYSDPTLPGFGPTGLTLADARLNASVSYTLLPTGGTPPFTWSVASGSVLPPGLNLFSGTSLSAYSSGQATGLTYLQGAASAAGSYSFDLTATDAAGVQMTRTFTLRVSPIAILGGTLPTPVTGVPYSEQLTVVGGTPPYTFTYGLAGINTDLFPQGLTASATGLISGTPASVGNFGFFATVQDSAGNTYTGRYSYTVTNSFGLNITTPIPFGLSAGTGYSATLATSGASTYTWSIAAGTLPAGLSLVPSGSSTILAGAPSTPGTYTYTVRAVDNANAANIAERVFTVPVSAMQYTAGINPLSNYLPPARVGAFYTYTYKIAGGAPPYTFTTVPSLYPLPAGLSLSADGVLSGTPQQSGNFFFYFVLSDTAGSSGRVFGGNLNVLGPGQVNPVQGLSVDLNAAAAGSAYAAALDEGLQGGVPPFTWSVAAGASLPPGMAILPGSNGVSSYLGGIPSTAGAYSFALQATDATGQIAITQNTLTVSLIRMSPEVLPNGNAGVAYRATFEGQSVGTTFRFSTGSSVPPGLTLSATGLLSGTPSAAGFFKIRITATDSGGNNTTGEFPVVIDAAGAAQGIGIGLDNPFPVNFVSVNYVLTGPAPAPVPIIVSATTGSLPFNAIVSGIPGAALSAPAGNAPATLNLSLNTAGLSAGTYAGVVAINSAQSANVRTGIPIVLAVTNPALCTYTLDPTGGSMAAAGGSGSFSMSAGPLCAWSPVASDPAMITVTSGAGPGSGTVSYSIAPNSGLNQRTGAILAGGQTYTITQFGSNCSFAINPASVNATAAGGIAVVSVTASDAGCAWTASGLGASPASGTGNGSVTLIIPPNGSLAGRVLNATVAGQAFTANQSSVNCTAGLSAASVSVASAGGSGSVNVTTPAACTYSTVTGPAWISVISGASGAGPGPVALNYTVAANSTTSPRTGTLAIGGQNFVVNQDPTPCSVTVDASALGSPFGSLGGSGTLGITANGPNCSWTASSGAAWAAVTPASGTGNGSIAVTAASNAASAVARSTTVTVAGQSIGLTQAGTTCTYNLGSATANVPFGGGSGSVTVSAPAACLWSASPDVSAPWLTITSSGSAGTGDVTFVAAPNPNVGQRLGSLTIAGQTYLVRQDGEPCDPVLSASNITLAAQGGSSSFTFTIPLGVCPAKAVSYSGWLAVTTVGGITAPGSVSFTAAPNPAGVARTGTIQYGRQTFTVTQTGAACAFSLNAYGVLLSKTGGAGSVLGSQSAVGCTPAAGADQPSIVSLGTLTGPVQSVFTLPYSVTPFNSIVTTVQKATITFGGQIFTVKQTSW